MTWPMLAQTAPAQDVPLTPPITARKALAFAASVFMLLIFSQAWSVILVGPKVDESASTLLKVMFFPAYGSGLLVLMMQPLETLRAVLRQPLLVLILLVVIASLFWSVVPDQTLRRIIAIVFTTLCGLVLAAHYRWDCLAEVVATTFAILVAGSFLVGLLVPGLGIMTEIFPGAWRGLWAEKNALGSLMAFGFGLFGAAALLQPKRAILWWGFAALALALVLLSTSKTSLVALVLGAAALAFVWLVRRGPLTAVISIWVAVVGVGLLALTLILASDWVFDLLGKDATLTGRTKIWAAAMRQIQLRPWLGYGYGAVWDQTSPWGQLAWIVKEAGFRARHAHNSWIEQWLGLGLVGLTAWSLYYIETVLRCLWAVFKDRGAYLALPFMMVYSLTTLTESVAVVYNDLRWVLFVALAVKLALGDRPQQV